MRHPYSDTLGSLRPGETCLSKRPSLSLSGLKKKEETADVSVSSDKGLMRGMTGERELEAVAHRLSRDPWLSASAGLPLSITNEEQSRQCCDRSSVVSFHSTAPTQPLVQIIATG